MSNNYIIHYNISTGKIYNILKQEFNEHYTNLLSNKDDRLIYGVQLTNSELQILKNNLDKSYVNRNNDSLSYSYGNNSISKFIYNSETIKNSPIIIQGHISISSGFSRLTRQTIDLFLKKNLKFQLHEISNIKCKNILSEKKLEYNKHFISNEQYPKDNNNILLSFTPPFLINNPRKKYNIIYTMMESYSVKPLFKKIMDSSWDAFITPTYFCKNLFSEFINPKRISVIPIGIDKTIFNPNIQKQQEITFKKIDYKLQKIVETSEKPKGFKLLNVSRFLHRKGSDLVLKSFAEEFSKKDDICLILFSMHENEVNSKFVETSILNLLKKYFIKNKELAPIFLVNTPYNEDEQSLPYSWGDAFILPSRGEGFGLTPLEAAACGLPLICSNNSGLSDYITENNSFVINHDKIDNIGKFEEGLGYIGDYPEWKYDSFYEHLNNVKFAIMNSSKILEEIKEKTRFVYENYSSEIVKTKIKNMEQTINEKYNWEQNSIELYEYFKNIL